MVTEKTIASISGGRPLQAEERTVESMSVLMNRQYYLSSRPRSVVTAAHVPHRDVPVAEPAEGQAVIRNMFISLDPAIRGWMDDSNNYIKPIDIGDAVRSSVIGRVIKSNSELVSEGDVVMSIGAWEAYTTAPAAGMTKLDEHAGVALSNFLSVLGPTGLTALFGLLEVSRPKAGETVLVSAAAGAVGSIVGQIAKMQGCRVVGMAGTDEKCRWLSDDLGFDGVINYKTCGDYEAAIRAVCPEGVDVYFDNVGGEILDAALMCLNKYARVTVCGWISTYNDADALGPKNLWQLVAESVTMQGFAVIDYMDRFAEGVDRLAGWVLAGKLQFKEEIVDGLDNVLPTFLRLFEGSNQGKLIIRIPE